MIRREGDDAEHERRDAPPVDENPADVEGDGGGDEDDAEDDEDDRSGLASGHGQAIRQSGNQAIRIATS